VAAIPGEVPAFYSGLRALQRIAAGAAGPETMAGKKAKK
jgi:hypothetical protein